MKIYLDDIRDPKGPGWVVIRTPQTFKDFVCIHGIPDEISFDHDLGPAPAATGYDLVKWLGDKIINEKIKLGKCKIPVINVHSANPVGKKNIEEYWKSLVKYINSPW